MTEVGNYGLYGTTVMSRTDSRIPTPSALCIYDISDSTLIIPEAFTGIRGLPAKLYNFPESMAEYGDAEFSKDTKSRIMSFYGAIRRGEPNGTSDIFSISRNGSKYWERMEFASIFGPDGSPEHALIAITDITEYQSQKEENIRLREDTQVLRILAEHSGRTICCYDPHTGFARHWGKENCEGCIMPPLCEKPYTDHMKSGVFPQKSVEILEGVFAEIEQGNANGNCMVQVNTENAAPRWVDFKYSTLCNDKGEAELAIFSYIDATERHQQELAYLREVQTVANDKDKYIGLLEIDLSEDRIESQGGRLTPPGISAVGQSFTEFGRNMVEMKFMEEDKPDGWRFFSSDYLLERYNRNEHSANEVWRMLFRDGSTGWVRCEVVLLKDPYIGHIRGLLKLTDVTEEWETQLTIQEQAQRDGLTGLLNRATAERRIRANTEKGSERGGVLILVDMDDLKTVNDVYGHDQGDRALRSIANCLTESFRFEDTIGRFGGDEFILFLPNAAGREISLSQTLSSLIKKFSGISVGENDEHRIHCSIGCASEIVGEDDFDSLLRKADLALYHVKRSGKNNYAFFQQEMMEENYVYRINHLHTGRKKQSCEMANKQYLYKAISAFYPMVVNVNLTRDHFMICEMPADETIALPDHGSVDELMESAVSILAAQSDQTIRKELSREHLLHFYENEGGSLRRYYRINGLPGSRLVEVLISFYTDDNRNVCCYILARKTDGKELPGTVQ